jgi:hypothetical protein
MARNSWIGYGRPVGKAGKPKRNAEMSEYQVWKRAVYIACANIIEPAKPNKSNICYTEFNIAQFPASTFIPFYI